MDIGNRNYSCCAFDTARKGEVRTDMKHTIEYNGERKTVEAKRTATVNEVLELAWPGLTWREDFSYDKVACIGTGRMGERKAVR